MKGFDWLKGKLSGGISKAQMFLKNVYQRHGDEDGAKSKAGILGFVSWVGQAVGFGVGLVGFGMVAAPWVLGFTWPLSLICMGLCFMLARQFFEVGELMHRMTGFVILVRAGFGKQLLDLQAVKP